MEYLTFLSKLNSLSEQTDIQFYAVGGFVRDRIMGIESVKDIDIAVVKDFENFIDLFKNHFSIEEERISQFKTALFDFGTFTVDIVTARKEVYPVQGKLPDITPSTIDDDLKRRDFTINSIAMRFPDNDYYDPLNGMNDIERGIIRGNRKGLFAEDPTRIFRLFKYRDRFSFTIADETIADLRSALNPELFANVSMSRISREWLILLDEAKCTDTAQAMNREGIFEIISGREISIMDDVNTSSDEALASTLAILRSNDIEDILNVSNILLNGLRKSTMKEIRHVINAIHTDTVPVKRELYDSVIRRIQQ